MARYFFDKFNSIEHVRDEVGLELPHRDAARQTSQVLLADMPRGKFPDGARREFVVDVRDELGLLIYTCRLSFVGRWLDHTVPPLGNRAVPASE
ncbi:DUF6894 family protein [Pararoseomonas indoligenes]|uniref:DUF6894 domain-containing protein n=1 Tax=Roseomonas indoligenes TaxID=2820811 RepID=A0A940N0F1_9PROT|nr:hypothetical protein [Pararoseomonas indoligenes]MBP0494978.1 hypothetical protein [Pararoseomonas indoligenes]